MPEATWEGTGPPGGSSSPQGTPGVTAAVVLKLRSRAAAGGEGTRNPVNSPFW